MYLLVSAKLCHMIIYDNHIGLLALNFYLLDAPIVFLFTEIELLWKHQNNMTLFTFFINDYEP